MSEHELIETVQDGQLPRVIGRYDLLAPIGRGGMATVYLGRLHGAAGFARPVAIKRLHPHLAGEREMARMLADEARLCGRVRHPNVVQILDVVSESGELFLVMEYVEGASLGALTDTLGKQDSSVPVEIAASIVCHVLDGLQAAHTARDAEGNALGIVHRDVSPQNILVGIDGVARLADFGVAKALDRSQSTRRGQIKGKLSYMAPEQVRGHEVTARTDIFAAGVVLWELLSERRLFTGATGAETLFNVLESKPVPPSAHRPGVSAALDAIVLCALANDPKERHASARVMAAAIEEAVRIVPARAIADWMSSVVGETLEDRARHAKSVLSGERSMDVTLPAPDSSPSPSPHAVDPEPASGATRGRASARRFVALGLVLALGFAALVAFGFRARSEPSPSSQATLPVQKSAPPVPAAAPPSPSPSALVTPGSAVPAPSPAPTSTFPRGKIKTKSRRRPCKTAEECIDRP